jgi:bifunctional non-homologous end joining protein LigD
MLLGAWGQGITAAKMKECLWLKPATAAETEFAEWIPGRTASARGVRWAAKQ